MPFSADEVRDRIMTALPGAHVEVTDLTGTSDHYEALIVAPQFAGRSRIEQHRLVYGALGQAVGQEIHALALRTLTPEAWGRGAESNGERNPRT
jgi:stress-induced morphogen